MKLLMNQNKNKLFLYMIVIFISLALIASFFSSIFMNESTGSLLFMASGLFISIACYLGIGMIVRNNDTIRNWLKS